MDATLTTINESQWLFCLLQITVLLSISWSVGRIVLRRFPDVSASIGVVGLAMSAGLIVLTWTGVERPFELTGSSIEAVRTATDLASDHPSVGASHSTVESEFSVPSWSGKLAAMINWTVASSSYGSAAESTWQLIAPVRVLRAMLLLSFLGGLVGVFRVVHSSTAIFRLTSRSSPVHDVQVRAEVRRILALIPIANRHQDIPVCQFKGHGSPFVSWLTGNTIFVPQSFLNWSASEQSVSLAHEIGHLRRRDNYCRIITQLTFCLTWLHPLAWLLHRQTVLAQELAADQVAAQATENSTDYCRGLSRLALRFDVQCRHSSAIGVSVSSSLIRRITMLREISFYRLTLQPIRKSLHHAICPYYLYLDWMLVSYRANLGSRKT